MQLLQKLVNLNGDDGEIPKERILSHRIHAELRELSTHTQIKTLAKDPLYLKLKQDLSGLLYGYEYGCYADKSNRPDPGFIRAICWHLEHGRNFEGILETIRNRAFVAHSDIYIFPTCDIGMTRSGNRNVIRDLALEMGYNYYYLNSYVNFPGEEEVPNQLGLEGSAIMTRYPLVNLRALSLKNYYDPLSETPKRLGCERVVIADVKVSDDQLLTVVCVNLPVRSSAWQRFRMMRSVLQDLKTLPEDRPILLAGDWKTSTYNCTSGFAFAASLLNKFYRDFDFIVKEHHTFPEKSFEKRLFGSLVHHGFHYKDLNETGVGCYHSLTRRLIERVSPSPQAEKIIQFLLKNRDTTLPFKYDWFAANQFIQQSASHQAERPRVITHLFHHGKAVSRHDPILLDFSITNP